MADPNLSERIELFTRKAADAVSEAVSRVLGARTWASLILHLAALSMLGLALYMGWMLVALQPEVVRRLSAKEEPSLRTRFAARRAEVQQLLQTMVHVEPTARQIGLDGLALISWDGVPTFEVLASTGMISGSVLAPIPPSRLASGLGPVMLGMCHRYELPPATPVPSRVPPQTLLLCPLVTTTGPIEGMLLGLFHPLVPAQQQHAELVLMTRRLNELLYRRKG
jgi:hypothetical protein